MWGIETKKSFFNSPVWLSLGFGYIFTRKKKFLKNILGWTKIRKNQQKYGKKTFRVCLFPTVWKNCYLFGVWTQPEWNIDSTNGVFFAKKCQLNFIFNFQMSTFGILYNFLHNLVVFVQKTNIWKIEKLLLIFLALIILGKG